MQSSRRQSSGSTLLLALWALLLLSAIVFGWAKLISQRLDIAGEATQALNARALAHSGLAVGLHPAVTGTSPFLDAQFDQNSSYHVTIDGEGAKINLNYVLTGADPNRLLFLKRYLEYRGLNLKERETFVDCVLDWVEPPHPRRPNGAEDDNDYHPAHALFKTLDELQQVKGTGPLLAIPNWKDDFTLLSSGPLDTECVSEAILSLVPNLSKEKVKAFIAIRQGPDHRDHTPDDRVFKDINEVYSYLGLSSQHLEAISGLLAFRDQIVHIHSVGVSGKVDRQVDVVARKVPGANPEILQWKEK